MNSKIKKHMNAVAEMPHQEDMFQDSAYINRMITIRPDISGELCRGNISRRPERCNVKMWTKNRNDILGLTHHCIVIIIIKTILSSDYVLLK